MKAPSGSYLITGLPRCRTAWLAALLYGDIPCYHDNPGSLLALVAIGTPFGLSSPSLVAWKPMLAVEIFADAPIVVVHRPAIDSRASHEAWFGSRLENWKIIEDRFAWFMREVPRDRLLVVESSELDNYEAANRVHFHCLGTPLPAEKFGVFNLLKIEQHRQKVERAQKWPG